MFPSSKSLIVLRYNPHMVDSLKCLFFVRNSPRKEVVIDAVEDKSVRAPVLKSKDLGLLKGAIPIGRLLWDPEASYGITEWLDYSKFEIVPYIWAPSQRHRLQASLRRLDNHLGGSKYLVENQYSIADASLALDLIPAFHLRLLDPSSFVHLRQWYDGLLAMKGVKELSTRILGVLDGSVTKSASSGVPRVLCIHGYRQSGSAFKLKLGAFMKLFKKKVEFVFLDSPHVIGGGSDEQDVMEDPQRGWWFSNEKRSYSAFEESTIRIGLEESVNLILKKIKEDSIDGILCFSQGAALIAWMAMRGALRDSPIKFIILVASFKSSSLDYSSESLRVCGIPSLHVVGNSDAVIPSEKSKEVLEYFDKESVRVLFHSGGHFVPAKSDHKQIYLNFIESYA
eukprot:TRINITY_DN8186_c0_g1_i2.p1 TRINITY_DN8186_c0_g1~~TRINITY_DN8186_c0_g1_i2.p1  ORF type:complete len:396 (+),score=109.47 TRINITY_DN8186_c0_g1_i2:74-1261(+)